MKDIICTLWIYHIEGNKEKEKDNFSEWMSAENMLHGDFLKVEQWSHSKPKKEKKRGKKIKKKKLIENKKIKG